MSIDGSNKQERAMGGTIHGVTSMAARRILDDLCAAFAEAGGSRVAFTAMGGVEAARRVKEGLAVDLVALAANAIDALEAGGILRRGSRVDYARSGIALAIPSGATRPAVATAGDVRAAMLAAPRVAYSTGPSGAYLLSLWERWGVGREMAGRAVQAPAGVPVAALLARGEADLGVQQYSELLEQPGIEILGPLPDSIQQITVF